MKSKRIAIIGVSILVLGTCIILLVWNWNWVKPRTGIFKYTTKTTIELADKDLQGKSIKVTEEIQASKTFWDLLQLAGIPFVLAGGGYLLNQREQERDEKRKEAEQNRAAENLREEALQTYFDRISELLLEHNLGEPHHLFPVPGQNPDQNNNPARDIARARTLTVLSRLDRDGQRKAAIVKFLHEAELIKKEVPIIHLDSADLSNANLNHVDLRDANLSGANLRSAILAGADLRSVNLSHTDLRDANLGEALLNDADLSFAKLSWSNLRNALLSSSNLRHANLNGADLSYANLTCINLNKARLSGAKLIAANLDTSSLRYADLRYADFDSSNLSYANFLEADLSETDLRHANLRHANLNGANLQGANLQNANLQDNDLRGVKNLIELQLDEAKLCETTKPNGEVSDRDCEKLRKEEEEQINKLSDDSYDLYLNEDEN
jgi:uncharacterized protein YjbI with pentapeptide repeats